MSQKSNEPTNTKPSLEEEMAAKLELEFAGQEREIDHNQLKAAMRQATAHLDGAAEPITVDLNGDVIASGQKTLAQMVASMSTEAIINENKIALQSLMTQKNNLITRKQVLETERVSKSKEAIEKSTDNTTRARKLFEEAIKKADQILENELSEVRKEFDERDYICNAEMNEIGRKIQSVQNSLLGLEGMLSPPNNTSPLFAPPESVLGYKTTQELSLGELASLDEGTSRKSLGELSDIVRGEKSDDA